MAADKVDFRATTRDARVYTGEALYPKSCVK